MVESTPCLLSTGGINYTTSTSLHLHRAPRPRDLETSNLETSISLYRYTYSAPPYLHTSTSLRLQRASRASELQTSIPLLFARLQRASRSAYLHVATPPAGLQSSTHPCLYTSMSLHLQRASRAPCLRVANACSEPADLHIATPVARLQSSTPPYLYIATFTSRPRPSGFHISYRYAWVAYPDIHTSTRPRPYACSAPLELQNSRAPYLYVSTPVVSFQSSITSRRYTDLFHCQHLV